MLLAKLGPAKVWIQTTPLWTKFAPSLNLNKDWTKYELQFLGQPSLNKVWTKCEDIIHRAPLTFLDDLYLNKQCTKFAPPYLAFEQAEQRLNQMWTKFEFLAINLNNEWTKFKFEQSLNIVWPEFEQSMNFVFKDCSGPHSPGSTTFPPDIKGKTLSLGLRNFLGSWL